MGFCLQDPKLQASLLETNKCKPLVLVLSFMKVRKLRVDMQNDIYDPEEKDLFNHLHEVDTLNFLLMLSYDMHSNMYN